MKDSAKFSQANEVLSALERAYAFVEKSVESETDPHQAFELATILTEASRQMTIRLGQLRALQAARLRDQGSLSLAALADQLGISKTRAQQIMEAAAKAQDDATRPPAA